MIITVLCSCITLLRKPEKHHEEKSIKQNPNEMIGYTERVKEMSDWEKYKENVRKNNPEIGEDIDEVEKISSIVGAMIEQRHVMKLSQRDLAKLCGIPHSSVARIESGVSVPNLSTLIKILNKLGLIIYVEPAMRISEPNKHG